jgi:uncharacterized protein (DUF362 family)
MSTVAVLKTSPDTVLDDYRRLMELARYREFLPDQYDTLIKLNLSWTKFFPACSSAPWQLEGVVRTMVEGGWNPSKLIPIENKTVVTNPRLGAVNNKWMPVLDKYGLTFVPLPEVEWIRYEFKSKLLKLNDIFPEGIQIPKMFVGRNILHLPTVKTHGHSTTTGAIKNAFGGLLKEVRHYAHKYIHEVLVDLLLMQRELHPGVFAVMDGTVCGDGAGPRTMDPKVKNYILASGDSVAIVRRPEGDRGRGRGRLRGQLRVQDEEEPCHRRRPDDPQGLASALGEDAPPLSACSLGPACLDYLPRLVLVSYEGPADHQRVHEVRVGACMGQVQVTRLLLDGQQTGLRASVRPHQEALAIIPVLRFKA